MHRSPSFPALDRPLVRLFRRALRLLVFKPRLARRAAAFLYRQSTAKRRRKKAGRRGIPVPPLLIVSVTRQCNLHCAGCYSRHLRPPADDEISIERLDGLFSEAVTLGVSVVLLAGGEPLLRPTLLDLVDRHRRLLFLVFTNGTLLEGPLLERLAHSRTVPVLSLEGGRTSTDERRGSGVLAQLERGMNALFTHGLFWGVSLTVTRDNLAETTDRAFCEKLISAGCRLFFHVAYVPVTTGSEETALDAVGLATLAERSDALAATLPALFINFPGDEEKYGGCLAAGRGFVHIGPEGTVEPCPFVPLADRSLTAETSLADALASPFLARLRETPQELEHELGGCALYSKLEELKTLRDG